MGTLSTSTLLLILALAPVAFSVIVRNSPTKIVHHALKDRTHTHVAEDTLNFLVLGDWGGLPVTPYKTPVEVAIAKQMGLTADAYLSKFTIALGDNFYFDGVENVDDKRFSETYETVFQATALDTPWYFIAGNHDHNGNVSAEIAYTDKLGRWQFPDYYYNMTFVVDENTGATVEIVLIDTVLLCGNSDYDFLHKAPVPHTDPESRKIADDQWAWIEQTLTQSTANYLIVGGHYPVYSVAEHGSTKCLVDRLLPLLEKCRVQAYINGHDHNLQHVQVTAASNNYTTQYFTVGSANFIEDSQKHINTIPKDSLKYYWADTSKLGGFGVFSVNKESMTFRFIDAETGETLHTQQMLPENDRGRR